MPPRTRNPSSANGSPLSPPGEGSRPGQTSPLASAQRFRRPPPEDPVAAKVQSLSTEARIFLTYDFDSISHKPLKLHYYNIIYLFNPATKSRPGDKKDALKKVFIDEVRPLLKPYLLPPPSTPMETDSADLDFDPLSRKTTRPMLVKAILSKSPKTDVSPGATIDDVLILYKRYVDPHLKLPPNDRFTKRPRAVPINRLKSESMEDLLLALRYLAPRVFVRSLAMNKSCLMDLYIKFVHDKTPDRPLILGYHYTLLDLSPSDLVSESMEEDVVEGAKCKIQISSYVFW